MHTRQFIHDPQELLSQGRALVKDNSDIKFAYRVTMVNLLLGGMSAKELAEHCGDGETTLMSWVKKVDGNGWNSLRAKKQTGQPRRLTNEQIAKLKVNVSSNPNNFGFNVWDGPSLSKHIKDKFDVETGGACHWSIDVMVSLIAATTTEAGRVYSTELMKRNTKQESNNEGVV